MSQSLRIKLDKHPFGLDRSSGMALAHRMRCSPTVWVLAASLVPALIFTPLTRSLYPDWWQLMGYFWYSIPASSFVYLPHEPAVIFAGAIYDPEFVAVAGGLATIVAAIVDYFVVRKVFEFQRIAPIKQTALYKRAGRFFYWRPWPTMVALAFSPVPSPSDTGSQLRLPPVEVRLSLCHRAGAPVLSSCHGRGLDACPY